MSEVKIEWRVASMLVLIVLVLLACGCDPPGPEAAAIQWEAVSYGLCRVRVPGGWIYKYSYSGPSPSICFVPDPQTKGF